MSIFQRRFIGHPFSLALLFVVTFVGSLRAGGESENVLLVVNAKSEHSLAIANLYIDLRKIPASNVVYLEFDLKKELCGLKVFKRDFLTPIFQAIEDRNLTDQIDCIVYSSGFPTRVNIQPHLKIYLEQTGEEYQLQKHAPFSSLSSLTYYGAQVMADDPSYMRLNSNLYMRRPVANFQKQPFVGQAQQDYTAARKNLESGKPKVATQQLQKLVDAHPDQAPVRYELARALARSGELDDAMEQLSEAVDRGWSYRDLTRKDSALTSLRQNGEFKSLLEAMDNEAPGMLPTQGFSNQYYWGPNGWPNNDAAQGQRLMISTVLAVSPEIGGSASLEDSIDQITRTVRVDGTSPEGTFFFAKHKDVRSRTRTNQFAQAVEAIKNLGMNAEVIEDRMPQNSTVLGATLGSAKVPWTKSGSQFQAGAICDNLTSYGGWMEKKKSQTPITDFLKYGAAGASGAVYEPYAIHYKFPSAMIHAHYARGCTLGEAFYQSIHGPFQMLIVGDALCRPFASLPQFEVRGIKPNDTVSGPFELTVNPSSGPEIASVELFMDGRKFATTEPGKSFEVPAQSLSAGYHELRVVAIEKSLIGTRASQRFGFQVRQGNKRVVLKVAGDGTFKLSDEVVVNATTTVGRQINLFQNSRQVGQVSGKSGQVRIPAKLLGRGKTTLYGVVADGSKNIASQPLEIEITP